MNLDTRRLRQILMYVSSALLLPIVVVLSYRAFVPKAADFTLDAVSERVILEVSRGGPAFGWPALETYAVDGEAASCIVRSLQFGEDDVRVTVGVEDASAWAAQGRPRASSTGQWARILKIRLERAGKPDRPWNVSCVNDAQIQIRKSADLLIRAQLGQVVNLPVYAKVLVGGIVDPQGGPMGLLRSGSLRASARLKGSTHLPVSSVIELRPGDEVRVTPDSDERESLSVGVMRFDGNELALVTHARGSVAVLRRAGLGGAEEFNLRPSLLALIQGNPMWSALTLVCAVVSTILGLALAVRAEGTKRTLERE